MIRAARKPMHALATLILAALLVPAVAVAGTDVWLDVDTAIGQPARDVDDGFAMVLALRSPELVVRGVSATFGNASLDTAVATSRDVLERFGAPALEVHAGARSAAALGEDSPAVRAMAAALAERPLTLLALGPLTNVATLLRRHPGLHGRIQRIVMVAGRRPGQRFAISAGHWHTFPDLNLELDAAAAAEVLASSVPLVLAPWEVASRVWITPEDLARLSRCGGGGAWLADRAQLWSSMWRWVLDAPGFNPFDTLAVGYVAHPELFVTEPVELALEDPRASSYWHLAHTSAPRLTASPAPGAGRAAYCASTSPAFKELLLRALEAAQPDQRVGAPPP